MQIDKTLIVDAIIGRGFASSIRFASEMQANGLARFCGDGHNEDWEWCREALEAMDAEQLEKLYELSKRQ